MTSVDRNGSPAFVARRAGRVAGRAELVHPHATAGDAWALELTVEAGGPDAVAGVAAELATAAAGRIRELGGGMLRCWQRDDDPAPAHAARALAMVEERELLQVRVALPVAPPVWPPGIELAAFRPGVDDRAWLDANNAAFAGHPEQEGWTPADLAPRLSAPWFDAAGFLLAWRGTTLAGFCWTKLHPAAGPDPALGEIYVIGVVPGEQGRGLGRALTLAGLAHLHERGAGVGMLYVDAANAGALSLYASIGFRPHRVDRCFAVEIAP